VKRLFPIIFVLIGCLLLTLGAVAFGAIFMTRGGDMPDVFAWKPPMDLVDNRSLAPATVMLPLTGVNSSDAVSAAFDKAHLENAFAVLAYDPTVPDPARVGALLQLGERYATAKDLRKAALCYQSAAQLATLSPTIADFARMDTYLQATAGLRKIGANDSARWVVDQSYLVAQNSPTMQIGQRVRRLDQVADAYQALGLTSLSNQARAKSLETSTATAGTLFSVPRPPFIPPSGKLPPSSEVDNAKNARIGAAKDLQDALSDSPPKSAKDWPKDLLDALSSSLQDEDDARQTYYAKQIAQNKDTGVKLALLRDQVNWLAIKNRVARGAFGITLVASWEKDRAAIADDWGAAWDDLFSLSESQAAALPKGQDTSPAVEDVIQQELIAQRWGWYTGTSEKDLTNKLGDVTQKLMDSNYPSLRIDTLTRNKKTSFILLPDELYGQGEKALPK
jgi:hypothetical protein